MLDALATLCLGSALLVSPRAASGDCGECSLEAGKVTLCRTHDKADGTELRRLKKLARSKEPQERIEALKGLAGLSSEHANAPSLEAAQLIAAYLEEELASARISAVAALLEGQHPEVVVATLSADVASIGRDWKVAEPQLAKWAAGKSDGPQSSNPKERAEFAEHVRVLQYGPYVVQALGKLPDERSSAALVEVLGWPVESTPAAFLRTAALSALELRTLAGAQAVIGLLEDLDAWLPGNPPAEPFPWQRPNQTFNDALVRNLTLRMQDSDYADVADRLRTTAQAMGLSGCPGEARGAAAAWKAWLAANATSFRSELGSLATPVHGQLETKKK